MKTTEWNAVRESADDSLRLEFAITLAVVVIGRRFKRNLARATGVTMAVAKTATSAALWTTPRTLPILTFLLNFSVSPQIMDALVDKDAEAWHALRVTYSMTLISAVLPGHWVTSRITRELRGDEDNYPYTWAMLSLVFMPVMALVIAIVGTISRLLWSML
jgi:hypothetical protein